MGLCPPLVLLLDAGDPICPGLHCLVLRFGRLGGCYPDCGQVCQSHRWYHICASVQNLDWYHDWILRCCELWTAPMVNSLEPRDWNTVRYTYLQLKGEIAVPHDSCDIWTAEIPGTACSWAIGLQTYTANGTWQRQLAIVWDPAIVQCEYLVKVFTTSDRHSSVLSIAQTGKLIRLRRWSGAGAKLNKYLRSRCVYNLVVQLSHDGY
jgi:hypothetical protein